MCGITWVVVSLQCKGKSRRSLPSLFLKSFNIKIMYWTKFSIAFRNPLNDSQEITKCNLLLSRRLNHLDPQENSRNIFVYANILIRMMDEKVKLLKALGEETRMKIVRCLLNGEKCACSLVLVVEKSQPNISRNLKLLEGAGILESRRDGINIYYKIASKETREILNILGIEKIAVQDKC